MDSIIPPKLKKGDYIGIIAPSLNADIISKEIFKSAQLNLEKLGFKVKYAKNARNHFKYGFSSMEERVHDLHLMFLDDKIDAVMALIGGFVSNQLLELIDFELVKKHPKPLIGFSDTTALLNGIYAKTGMITYCGPCFANFAQKYSPFEVEKESFMNNLMQNYSDIKLKSSSIWAEDKWWMHLKEKRELKKNEGWNVVRAGKTTGTSIGGNLSTFLALIGTPFIPEVKGKILFIEEDPNFGLYHVERMLFQLKQSGILEHLKGLIIGRFGSNIKLKRNDEGSLFNILTKKYDYPVICNVDFGHTNPIETFPIGGNCIIDTEKNEIKFVNQT